MSRRRWVELPQKDSVQWEIMHGAWFDRLNELQKRWVPNTPENSGVRTSLISEAWECAYMGCMQRAGDYTDDERSQAAGYLLADIKRYDPSQKGLGEYISYHITKRLQDAYQKGIDIESDVPPEAAEAADADSCKQLSSRKGILVSNATVADDNLDSALEGQLADPAPDPELEWIQKEAAQAVIIALVLNFVSLKNGSKHEGTVRHYRMFYTEQVTFSAQIVSLPQNRGKDILEALHQPYFRYFTENVRPNEPITLGTIENAILKMAGELIPGKRRDEPLQWDQAGFLPAKVQITYLKRNGVTVSPSAISNHRKRYQTALLAQQKNAV